jgi:hypothetical protein
MLFRLWSDEPHRATRDVDFLAFRQLSLVELVEIFRALCRQPVQPDDGLVFRPESVTAERIRARTEHGGTRVRLRADLARMRLLLQADVGFGDPVTPGVMEERYPTLLDLPAPRLRVYPRETVVAEKLEAVVLLGEENTRLKDFYDLWVLARRFEFAGETLGRAIRATFAARRTPLPQETPRALSPTFFEDAAKNAQWRAFCARSSLLEAPPVSFSEVGETLREFLVPLLTMLAAEAEPKDRWPVGGPWRLPT